MINKKLLSKLISIESIYPGERKIGEFLYQHLSEIGFTVQKQKVGSGRFNLFASKGHGKKALLFYSHMDTIPLSNLSKWRTNPFKLQENKGRYYGLGAYDMKGGLTAILDAVSSTNRYVKLFLAVDEENISQGSWKAVKEKRKFFEDAELIISAEPNFGLGVNGITVGRTGRYIFQINFKGKAQHIAHYQNAVDAIDLLGKFLVKFYSKRQKIFKDKNSIAQVRKITGESVGMSVCGKASLEVEVLAGPKDSIEETKKTLQNISKAEVYLKPRKTPYLSGYHFESFPFQKEIVKIIKSKTGKRMKLHQRKSVGDDNVLATLEIPVITWGPGGGNAHTPNEWVNKKDLTTLSEMYIELLKTRTN